MELTAALTPRTRFFLVLVPRMVAGRCSATRVAGYALSLLESGNRRLGAWCWKRAVRSSVFDENVCGTLIELCLSKGRHREAEELANRSYDASGLIPAAAVRLVGELVLREAFDSALRVLDRLLEQCGEGFAERSPAPKHDRLFSGIELRDMLADRAGSDSVSAAEAARLHCSFARLCFSFSAFATSAGLYERAGKDAVLDAEDRIARAYALLRSERSDQARDVCDAFPLELRSADADWQTLFATVAFASGAVDAATSAVETAVRARYDGHADIERIVADCREIVTCISACRDELIFSADDAADDPPSKNDAGLRKIFVCGNGWSGSGALYDALSEYDCFSEAPDTPIDRYVNAFTGNEMMFVQGPAGLGVLWRSARHKRRLSRRQLWDLFRCHVIGAGPIGHSEHKSAKTAANLVATLGSRYTAVFRRTFDAVATLSEGTPLSTLRGLLADTTESLTAVLADDADRCVIYNNAVFGPNVDMLEIFSNFKAAVVTRDPLDQFADRRAQDLKHWMTAGRFVPFYIRSRELFHSRRKQMRPEHGRQIREVEFERFVLDAQYRQGVLEWLLEGRSARRVRNRFEPERSARNVGIHVALLAQHEDEVIRKGLKQWCRS